VTELKQSYFFESLSDEQLRQIGTFSKKVRYSKGRVLFYEKEPTKSLVLLIEGSVKIYKIDLKNNEVVLGHFKAPSLIAEMATLEGIPYPASAVFETDGAVIMIDFERFKEEFLNDPAISFNFIKSLSKKIKRLENLISLNIVLDSTARLAKYIYDHEDALSSLKNYELAHDLHMTPETLSRTLKKLSVLQLLEREPSGYRVANREGLKVLFE
jgi:CRP/FNR family transcriptional regulator